MMNAWKLTVALAMAGIGFSAAPLVAAPLAATSSDMVSVAGGSETHRSASGPVSEALIRVAEVAPAATGSSEAVPTAPAGQGTHEAPSAAAHGAAGEGNVVDAHANHFPPFDATTFPSQLLWLAVTFGLLYLLMSRVTLPRIGRILEERHDRIADDLEEAVKHKKESEAAQQAYEKALNEARAKANTIAGETRDRLAADADNNRKTLEAELAAKLTAAEERIAATKTEALGHVRGIAVDTANTIVSTLAGVSPAQAEVEKAVDGALAQKDAA